MADGQGVLNEEHYQQIQQGLDQIAEAERQIKLAKQAGLDTSHYEQTVKEQKQLLTGLKQTYFPNR